MNLKAKTIALFFDVTSQFSEFLDSNRYNITIEVSTENDLFIEFSNKQIPDYLLVDPKKITEKTLSFLNKNSPRQIIIIVNQNIDQVDYTKLFKKAVPYSNIKIIKIDDLSTNLIEQVINEAEVENSQLSYGTNKLKENNLKNKYNLYNSDGELRYLFISLLGVCSNGEVMLFEDIIEKRLVARKRTYTFYLNEKIKLKIKEKEEQIKIIKSPTIIEVYDIVENSDNRFVDMEFANEGTLEQYIKKVRNNNEIITADEILNWFVQILISLKVLHNSNICHGEIKPENIYLFKDPKTSSTKNKNMITKISTLDNGISHMISLYENHGIIYPVQYLAPEMLCDYKYDTQIDIWALAIVLYELTMGKRPFEYSDTSCDLISEILENDVQNTIPNSIDYRIRYLLHNLLKKNPNNRLSINEIFKLNFIREKIEIMLSTFPEWLEKYPIFTEILALKSIQCSYEPSFLNSEDIKIVKSVFDIMENCSCSSYKKSLMSNKINNSYKGKDIKAYIKQVLNDNDNELSTFNMLNSLIKNRILVNVSIISKEDFDDYDYYILSCDSRNSNYDNPKFGNLQPIYKQTNINCLPEHLIIIGEELIKVILSENQLEKSNSKYIEFLFGISLFQGFNILDENQFEDVNYKHAFLLNLYQVMIIYNLLIEYFEQRKNTGFFNKIFKNQISVNLKFNDCSLNNLELRHGIFRGNKKPKENYFRICSPNDPILSIIKGINVSVCDLLIVNKLVSLESFSEDSYLIRIFTGKNLEYQINQYIVDFSNKCVSLDKNEICISSLYEKYFESDLGGAEGLFIAIFNANNYNHDIKHSILKIKNVSDCNLTNYKNLRTLLNNIKSGIVSVVFAN